MSGTVTFFSSEVTSHEVKLSTEEAPVILELLGFPVIPDFFEGDLDSTTFLSRVEYAQENLTGNTPDWVWTAVENLHVLASKASEFERDILWE